MFFVNICGKRTGKYMKKRILITGVLVALIMFVFILMGKKIVNSIWFKTQWDINLMMSHINSTPRQSLGGLSPITLAKLMLPQELLKYFGLTEIPVDEIILTPALLKR